jgi:hypothetical protein
MLKVVNGQNIKFRFGFIIAGSYVDPIAEASPIDVYASVIRGQDSYGNVIHPVTSMLNSSYRISGITPSALVSGSISPTFTFSSEHTLRVDDEVVVYGVGGGYDLSYTVKSVTNTYTVVLTASVTTLPNLSSFDNTKHKARLTLKNDFYFNRYSSSEYQFIYTIPEELSSGYYTLIIQATINQRQQIIEHNFEVSARLSLKTGSLTSRFYSNGILTLTTENAHNLSVGDFVTVNDIYGDIDGSYYISAVPTSNKFSFPLNLDIQTGALDIIGGYAADQNIGISGLQSGPTASTSVSRRPIYDFLETNTTNSILLLGHSDGLELNEITKIHSMQEAINVLGANMNSPLLRGVYDAFSCGARNIHIAAVAPMSEYVEDVSSRLTAMDFLYSNAQAKNLNFYEKYHERLAVTYNLIKGSELIDVVVPLEVSILGTGDVDFITQLAVYCYDFNATTGYVQLGVIGSRSNGMSNSDIAILESNPIFRNKLTTYDPNGLITSDIGRYIIPIYGELTFNHLGFNKSYTSSAAAAFAGTMSSNPVYHGMIRTRITGAYSVYGVNLSKDSLARLDNLNINTIYRSRKALRGYPYESFITNDYTMANLTSSFIKAPQMRLVAMVINEIKIIGNDSLGKNSEDRITSQIKSMLDILLTTRAIKDYTLQSYASKTERGFLIFEIGLISSLGLKNINFSVTTGPGA